MKTFTASLITVVLLSSTLNSAHAARKLTPTFEKQLIQMCEAIRDDNRLKLGKLMKRNRVSHRDIAKGLRCNGQDAIAFALDHHSMEVAKVIAKRANINLEGLLAKR